MSENAAQRAVDAISNNLGRDIGNPQTGGPHEIDSAQLFAGTKEVLIRHAGERYTLRQTSKGKLILTK